MGREGMKKTVLTLLTLSTVLLAGQAMATQQPVKLASDSRIEVASYSPTNVVPINGTTFTTTQVTFGKDEFIEDVQNGDSAAWMVSINKGLPNMLFLKPTAYNSKTNMVVVTNKHTYYFTLASNAEGKGSTAKATYALHFIYPVERQARLAKALHFKRQQKQADLSHFKNPKAMNWDYSFNGDKSIMPLHVFDDGKFTYLQLRPNQPVPALFVVTSPNGKESVVNYRQRGQTMVIQRTAPQFTLRQGKDHVASIFNNRLIAKLRG